MNRENLVAERVVIESHRRIVSYFGEKDPTTRGLMEQILANEEEHADDLADLLFAVAPVTAGKTRRLYFPDEVPGEADGNDLKLRARE